MKNQHPNIKHKQISMLDFALYQSKIVMVILWILGMLILFPIVSRAQVVRINIDIPSKMGLIGSIMPFELNDSRIDSNTGLLKLEGNYAVGIFGSENQQLIVTMSHSDFLCSNMDDRMTLKANLSYRNDGNSEPPRTDTVNRIAFPLSNSGRIIENMNGLPQVLNAYIFIHVIAGMPEDENNRCRGSLDLNIEYN